MHWIRRMFTYMAIGILFFMIFHLSRTFVETYRTGSQVDVLAQEIEELEKERKVLAQEVQYRGTNEFVEKEARDKLYMIKPGETQIVIEKDILLVPNANEEEFVSKTTPQQWQQLLLGQVLFPNDLCVAWLGEQCQ